MKKLLLFAVFTMLGLGAIAQVGITKKSDNANATQADAKTLYWTTVADGTVTSNRLPIFALSADVVGTKSQTIYPASLLEDLSYGDTIVALSYYVAYPAFDPFTGTFNVYMDEVPEAAYGTDDALDAAKLVYSGTLDATGTKMTINLQTPYIYNGGNLLVSIEVVTAGNFDGTTFYGCTEEDASVVVTTSTYIYDFMPKVDFEYKLGPDRPEWEFEWGDTLDYTNGNNAVGWYGTTTQHFGVMYPADLMSGRNYLVAVMMPYVKAGEYVISFYEGGVNAPGELTYEQTYTFTEDPTDYWFTFYLDAPQTICDTMNLWVVVQANSENFHFQFTDFCGDHNSFWRRLDDGTWFTESKTMMIKTITSDTDLNTVSISGPSEGTTYQSYTFVAEGPADASYYWDFENCLSSVQNGGPTATADWDEAGIYTITLTATRESGVAITDEMEITITSEEPPAGIDGVGQPDVSIYPNPATSEINIHAEGFLNLEVYDEAGRRVMGADHTVVDISSLAAGIYTVNVRTDRGTSVQKLVKK